MLVCLHINYYIFILRIEYILCVKSHHIWPIIIAVVLIIAGKYHSEK